MDGKPAHGQTVFLKEGVSITVTKTSTGDVTARADSYFDNVARYFSKTKECSGVSLKQNYQANYIAQFSVAHLLDEYIIHLVVANESGSVIRNQTEHAISDVAEDICEVIKKASAGSTSAQEQ